jgi:hypothetical protein
MQQRFLKLNVLVQLYTTKDAEGKGVWEASSKSLNMSAQDDTPDKALEALRKILVDTENHAVRTGAKTIYVSKKKEALEEGEETLVNAKIPYTAESLYEVNMDQLRAWAEPFGIKGRSKEELRNALLELLNPGGIDGQEESDKETETESDKASEQGSAGSDQDSGGSGEETGEGEEGGTEGEESGNEDSGESGSEEEQEDSEGDEEGSEGSGDGSVGEFELDDEEEEA